MGPRELLLTAKAMHHKMVELNSESRTVWSEMKAIEWFHYRPTAEGKVQQSRALGAKPYRGYA